MANAILNERLLKTQKVSEEQQDRLVDIYHTISALTLCANSDKEVWTNGNGPLYAEIMENLEFSLQRNWNFLEDKLKHTHWNRFAACSCPKIDNRERFGYPKIISMDCPFHGGIKQ